jgi:hypothetical protein
MGPIRNPRWEQKQTEGYVIVSSVWRIFYLKKKKKKNVQFRCKWLEKLTGVKDKYI